METNISLLNNIFLKLYLILGIIAISSCVHPTQIVAVDTMMAKVVGDVNIQYTSTKTSISYSSVDTIFVWGLYKYNDTTYTTYLNLPKVIQPGNYQIGSIVKNVLIECTFSKTFPTAGGDDYKSYYLNHLTKNI